MNLKLIGVGKPEREPIKVPEADVIPPAQVAANALVIGSAICVVCGKDTGLSQIDLENCDPVCSEDCSNKRVKYFR